MWRNYAVFKVASYPTLEQVLIDEVSGVAKGSSVTPRMPDSRSMSAYT